TVQMLELPHPLLAYNIDVDRFFRGTIHSVVDACAPQKNTHGDHKGYSHPYRFESVRSPDRPWNLCFFAASILDREVCYQEGKRTAEDYRHRPQEPVQAVNTTGET